MSGKEKAKGSLALAAPRVITIPANVPEIGRKLRVAAYARVSSNSDDQTHSFAAQNAYFSKLIAGNPNWELADIYADKGVTGTSIDKREDFLRMMEDCRKGRIDRILVKSISRFGRNTRERLKAVRELAGLGVIVLFEEQKIDTAETTGEMLTASSMLPTKTGAALSTLRQKYGDRPLLSFIWMACDRFLSLSPGRSSYLCRRAKFRKRGADMDQNVNYYGIILLLRQLRESGSFSEKELRRVAARIAADSGVDIMISL